jgi:hypothetical protein
METTDEGKAIETAPVERSGVMLYVDGILRHREDYFTDVFENKEIGKQVGLLVGIIVALSAFYGVVMGASSGIPGGIPQMLSSAVKVPVLYVLTLVVCYPVLYVINVIMGSRLGFLQTLTLILVAIALNAILLASCAPIVLFFTFTGANYDFLKLLHVLILGFSGLYAMVGLWRGLVAMCETSNLYPKQAIRILQIWILVFGFVGTQMVWSLRPFVGTPDLEFQLLRVREGQTGNFYQAVGHSALNLITPDRVRPWLADEDNAPQDQDEQGAAGRDNSDRN